jgi:DNA replication protein DnaC
MGLGRKAVQQGHRPLFTAARSRLAPVTKASAEQRVEDRLKRSTVPQLLISDARGYLPLDRHGAPLFVPLISRRDERGARILTAHQRFGQWAEVFGDPIVATAMRDRRWQHRHVINLQGDSSR